MAVRVYSCLVAVCFLLLNMPATATETCSSPDINLTSQDAVDNFQRSYGGADQFCEIVSNNLRIANVNNLTNLDGLNKLKRIGGSLEITNNDFGSGSNASNSLTDITGLENIESVGNMFELLNNSMLSDCSSVAPLLGYPDGEQYASVGNMIIVSYNAPGCNSIEEIYASATPSEPELFKIKIEEPANGGTASGIGNIRGWAIASPGVARLELFVDGTLVSEIPYGGVRADVEAAYPNVDNSRYSGFAQSQNFNLLGNGSHDVTIRGVSSDGYQIEERVEFQVGALSDSFIPEGDYPHLNEATVSVNSPQEIKISGLRLSDGTDREIKLAWSSKRQDFVTVEVSGGDELERVRETEYNNENLLANEFSPPAQIVGTLSELTDRDWFELTTDRNNRMIDVTVSSNPNNGPGNFGRWQVEWFGKICPDKEGVTLSRRSFDPEDDGFTYSVPACEAGVYRVEISVPDTNPIFYDSGEYSLTVRLSEWN